MVYNPVLAEACHERSLYVANHRWLFHTCKAAHYRRPKMYRKGFLRPG